MSLRHERMRATYVVSQLQRQGCYALYDPRLHQIRIYGPACAQLPEWLLNAIGESAEEILMLISLGIDACEDIPVRVEHTVHNCPCKGGNMVK